MKSVGVVLGLWMLSSACSGPLDEPDDAPGPDEGSTEQASSFAVLRAAGHGAGVGAGVGDRGPGSLRVRHALGAAAARLAGLQADAIGDTARNGLDDADPDDGGWDFIVPSSATQHGPAASPTNLFGAIGLGAWAGLASGSAGARALTVVLDAGAGMQRNPEIDSGPDFVFGVLAAELADNPGFAELARRRYDAKRAAAGGAAGLGTFIRDARHAANQDGLIAYDLGWFLLGAAALDAAFPGAGYDRDADAYAGIVVDDLGSASPRFDLGDPREGFYVTGLAWSQVATARLHASALFRQARASLLDAQRPDGAWGTAASGDDLQATAHALQTLALTGAQALSAARAVGRGARWLLQHQDGAGGWADAAGRELPLIDADIALGLMLSRTHAGDDGLIPGSPFAAPQRGAASDFSAAAPQP